MSFMGSRHLIALNSESITFNYCHTANGRANNSNFYLPTHLSYNKKYPKNSYCINKNQTSKISDLITFGKSLTQFPNEKWQILLYKGTYTPKKQNKFRRLQKIYKPWLQVISSVGIISKGLIGITQLVEITIQQKFIICTNKKDKVTLKRINLLL